jgi:hypothetical protein
MQTSPTRTEALFAFADDDRCMAPIERGQRGICAGTHQIQAPDVDDERSRRGGHLRPGLTTAFATSGPAVVAGRLKASRPDFW